MQLYYSLTSPFARIVRIALHEKALHDGTDHRVVNPWEDDADLMRVNPLTRVPTLVSDDGQAITESLLIVQYLEWLHPERPVVPAEVFARVLAEAGRAHGMIDAAVHKLLGRKVAGEAFDTSALGARRDRAIRQALDALEATPPGAIPELGAIATLVALEYIDFRFPEMAWRDQRPGLQAWYDAARQRPSVTETAPRE